MTIDIEIERARRAFDGPEEYSGELIETVIVGLQNDVHAAGVCTPEARTELRVLCERIIARIDQRQRVDALAG